MFSSINPCASLTSLTTNQNWSRSSFPTPLNSGNLIALVIIKCGFAGDGVLEEGGEVGEVGDGISGGDNCGIHYLIKLTILLGETQVRSSSLSRGGEIKGLIPNPLIPL